ncbi:dihydrofolate reductase family protein [Bowmanella sp. Y26]|uniref:dihydrofolate reductase family protein n=1 Tax=Bowmanella yangjiangensis TaxID=2811230 RepID=UPI001BDD452D|nr:dihydrofolate reductase family protein [Bowmanella yangjiangensis]MBT1062647.1 dihydrofolate reductase family protein [Bowmanella yangjiangensis]
MKCSVFIATSADGYIATLDGGVDWLDTGNEVDLGTQADMGFNQFIASVDCMIMGRGCMEKLASFNLTPEQWPYGNLRIIALSQRLQQVPANLQGKVELYAGDIESLVSTLQREGYQHAYIDGGATITSFLQAQLISHLTITQAPVLLGKGIPLFGELSQQVMLSHAKATAFANDFVQIQYDVSYK